MKERQPKSYQRARRKRRRRTRGGQGRGGGVRGGTFGAIFRRRNRKRRPVSSGQSEQEHALLETRWGGEAYSRLSAIAALCLPHCTLTLYSCTALSHCTFALHSRHCTLVTLPSTLCTLVSLYCTLDSVLSSLPLALHSRLCRLSVPSSLYTLAFCSDRALCSRP